MSPPAQPQQHPSGILRGRGLSKQLPTCDDDRVRSDNDRISRPSMHGQRLVSGDIHGGLARTRYRIGALIHAGGCGLEQVAGRSQYGGPAR